MPVPSLPPEILDTIVDLVADLSIPSLKELAITSHHFTSRCQSHLFSMMTAGPETVKKRLKMLEAHPTLFTYVRTIVLDFKFEPPDGRNEESNSELHAGISLLLDHLCGVSRLVIVFSRMYSNMLSRREEAYATWSKIRPWCRDVLQKAIKPPLDALYIQGLRDIPIQMILSLPSLKHVLLDKYAGFTKETVAIGVGSLAPRDLQWLSFHRTALNYIHPLLPSFCNVLHLTMEIAGLQEHRAAWAVLETLPRLESLVLSYSNRISYTVRNSNLISDCLLEMKNAGRSLPSFPHLRYMTITINAKDDSSDPECKVPMPVVVPGLLAVIISQNTQPSLEFFDFAGHWLVVKETSEAQRYKEKVLITRERGWAEIDQLLAERRLFPRLSIVRALAVPHRHSIYGIVRDQDTRSRAREQTLAVLQETKERVDVLDVGMDRDTEIRVNEYISTMLPARFTPDIE